MGQLSTHVDSQLDEIKVLILGARTTVEEKLQRICNNINYLCHRAREWKKARERRYVSIGEMLDQLELSHLMRQPERLQGHVEPIEAIAVQYLTAAPPLRPLQHQAYNIQPSLSTCW